MNDVGRVDSGWVVSGQVVSAGVVSGGVVSGSVTPSPAPDELAAIVAAIDAYWPRPAAAPPDTARRITTWRFSSRWWAKPVASRRDRPYR